MGYRSRSYRGNDDPTSFFLIFGIIISVFIIIWIFDYFRKKKIREYCEKNNLRYTENPVAMTGYSEAFDILDRGHSSYYTAGMYGKRGDIELNIVDYSYVTGSGKHRHVHNFTFCQLTKETTHFPCFFIRDENFILDSIGSMLGGQDIDFVEDKRFSDSFVLQGISESEIRKFFNRKVRSAFCKYHQKGYCYESKGRALLVYKSGHASLEGRITMLNTALRIFNEISTVKYEDDMEDIPRNPKYYG